MSPPVSRNLSTFITNLRLLDLDLRDDWPNVHSDPFSAKHARDNQKQRIRCVEWALYRLFELWNPREAKNKLQPFFPPYDSLRSLNLRAALYRSVNELKKDGVLGKEIMLRKTIFDECKGDKLEELLASFSTIVLQQTVRTRHGNKLNIAGQLATSQRIQTHDQKSLLPLAIAHQGALRALLRRKEQLKARYANLQKILDAKEQELLEKVDDLARVDQDLPSEAVSNRAMQDIRQHFDRNWEADNQWAGTIMEGDKRDTSDSLLDAPFHTIWGHVEDDTIQAIGVAAEQGLLEKFNHQIRDQQSRLQRWQKVQQGLIDERPKSPKKSKGQTTPFGSRTPQSPLKFGYVEKIQRTDSIDKTLIAPMSKAPDFVPDDHLESNVHESFETLPTLQEKGDQAHPTYYETSNLNHTVTQDEEVDSAIDMVLYDQTIRTSNSSPQNTPLGKILSENNKFRPDQSRPTQDQDVHLNTAIMQDHPASPGISVPRSAASADFPDGCPDSCPDEKGPLVKHSASSTQQDHSPSLKRTTSLMERTRQSMAFSRLETLLPDSAIHSSPSPEHQSGRQPEQEAAECIPTSLTERTRRSISLAPVPSISHKRPHNYRQSKPFPRNQFETPKKQLEDVKEATPPEILFSPEAEYASVFKSRPKVATSPNLSPDPLSISQWSGD
ncbi:MAG: hypothetical protein Q9222_002962 [Ikaeria aurantiellina]